MMSKAFIWLTCLAHIFRTTLASPSPIPSPAPSPSPTFLCESGQYLNYDTNLCIDCPVGHFSSFSSPPNPSNCSQCEVGTYTSTTGNTECFECSDGKYSNTLRTMCKSCNAGQYVFNNQCQNCSSGKYAPVPLDEGGCLSCVAGFYASITTSSGVIILIKFICKY